jgi:hypothetical protein
MTSTGGDGHMADDGPVPTLDPIRTRSRPRASVWRDCSNAGWTSRWRSWPSIWAGLVAYELIAPRDQASWLFVAGNVIWAIFGVELLAKLIVSGHPFRFLRRHWPSVLFLVLPSCGCCG